MELERRAHWIFDMDGTLTVAMHDFDAIRAELGLPAEKPMLEELAGRPADEARAIMLRLEEIELALARRARAAEGAVELLARLEQRGARLGILTRNSFNNSLETLRAAGLARFFDEAAIIDRERAAPKPDPGGIHQLLRDWRATPDQGVMVGDYRFDLLAGRAAGTATVYVDTSGDFPFAEHADLSVRSLVELLRRLA